jgi:GNAT superfamily N-acetyltransferase
LIRSLTVADITELESVQRESLPGSLPTLFGPRFFRLYYRSLMADPRFLSAGFFWESRLAGFLTYTTDTAALLSAAFRRHWAGYALAVGLGIARRPGTLRTTLKLLPGLLSLRGQQGSDVPAELLSYGVLREFRRSSDFFAEKHIHVARELLHRAFDELRGHGARRVKIFIQTEDVNPFINQFYREQGFQPVGRARRFGMPCNYLVREL